MSLPMLFLIIMQKSKSVFNKDKRNYYYNICLENASYGLPKKIMFCIKCKCYVMIELKFQKELMLIRQTNQCSVIYVTTGIF